MSIIDNGPSPEKREKMEAIKAKLDARDAMKAHNRLNHEAAERRRRFSGCSGPAYERAREGPKANGRATPPAPVHTLAAT